MVSVLTSVLSQTLWRVLGNDPHHPGLETHRHPCLQKPVTHNGQQRHAFACYTDHVSEAGVRCEAGEPGAWVVLDPLPPAGTHAPSLLELYASTCQGETHQDECRRQAPGSAGHDQPAVHHFQEGAGPLSSYVSDQESQEALSSAEDFCCWPGRDGPVTEAREEYPPGVTQRDRGAVVASSAAAAGSSAGNDRAGSRRQCQSIYRHHVEQPSRTPRRHCPSLHAAHTMEGPPEPHAPLAAADQPAFDPVQENSAITATIYKEDIRDFDIYKITGEEGQYPRLPALPTQSDSDTDDSSARMHAALRRRKRRKSELKLTGSKRLHREEEEESTTTTTQSSIHPHPAATLPWSSSATQGHCRVGDTWGESVVNDESDDDDDETSTVVPDDFVNDTDSDIEVLGQSGKCVLLTERQSHRRTGKD